MADKKSRKGEQCFQGPRLHRSVMLRTGRWSEVCALENLVDDSIDDAHRRGVRQSAGEAVRVDEVRRTLFWERKKSW